MKRFAILPALLALTLFTASCSDTNVPAAAEGATATEPIAASNITQWLDFGDELPWETEGIETEIPEFPNVTFKWMPETISAVKNGEETVLLYGMPILNACFADLNGDGLPELCASIMLGSGIADCRILVYDYANSEQYSLSDRMSFDYSLSAADGKLTVTKTSYSDSSVVSTGELAMTTSENGEKKLCFINEQPA